MFWLTFIHLVTTARLFWRILSWEFQHCIHPVHKDRRVLEALTWFRRIHCNFKDNRAKELFSSPRRNVRTYSSSWASQKSFPWRPSWRHFTNTDWQSHLELIWSQTWLSGVSARELFQCWCLRPDKHTAHGNKTSGQPNKRIAGISSWRGYSRLGKNLRT